MWNNFSWAAIRDIQVGMFGGRELGTAFYGSGKRYNPDFAAWARAFGIHALSLRPGDDIPGKVAQALAHPGPCVVEVHSSLEAISAFATITSLRGG